MPIRKGRSRRWGRRILFRRSARLGSVKRLITMERDDRSRSSKCASRAVASSENSRWGYTRIRGALTNRGARVRRNSEARRCPSGEVADPESESERLCRTVRLVGEIGMRRSGDSARRTPSSANLRRRHSPHTLRERQAPSLADIMREDPGEGAERARMRAPSEIGDAIAERRARRAR